MRRNLSHDPWQDVVYLPQKATQAERISGASSTVVNEIRMVNVTSEEVQRAKNILRMAAAQKEAEQERKNQTKLAGIPETELEKMTVDAWQKVDEPLKTVVTKISTTESISPAKGRTKVMAQSSGSTVS